MRVMVVPISIMPMMQLVPLIHVPFITKVLHVQ